MSLDRHQKMLISARYWLLGAGEYDQLFYKTLEIMEFAEGHHDGVRNGGEPEFSHQLGIFHDLRTVHKHLRNPSMVYSLAFGHDMIEDPNQKTKAYVNPDEVNHRWGDAYARKLRLMSKNILGQPNSAYSLTAIFEDEDAGPAKGADRVNNISTMVGVFKPERLQRYVTETEEQFLPLLKMARRRFPHQEAVYEHIKTSLLQQLVLIKHIMKMQFPFQPGESSGS